MTRYQSIISAIISAVCIFLLPVLNRKGIIVDENAATTIIVGIIGVCAFIWTAWKNHNLTDAAMEAQLIMAEIKAGMGTPEDEEDYSSIEEGEQ